MDGVATEAAALSPSGFRPGVGSGDRATDGAPNGTSSGLAEKEGFVVTGAGTVRFGTTGAESVGDAAEDSSDGSRSDEPFTPFVSVAPPARGGAPKALPDVGWPRPTTSLGTTEPKSGKRVAGSGVEAGLVLEKDGAGDASFGVSEGLDG